MNIKEYLAEAKPNTDGTERLVSSIHNMAEWERKPARIMIKLYLKKLEKDQAFMDRIKRRARQLGKDGYIWSSIRKRTISHFNGRLKPEFRK